MPATSVLHRLEFRNRGWKFLPRPAPCGHLC